MVDLLMSGLAIAGVISMFTLPLAVWALIGQGATCRRLEERNAAQSLAMLAERSVWWIVTSGDGERFRVWRDGMPDWTDQRDEATRYARRIDAEAVHREDEGAWCVLPVSGL